MKILNKNKIKKPKKIKLSKREETAQRIVNVKDIRDKFLYTMDGKIISYIQISPIDTNLFSKREKISITRILTSELTSERKILKLIAVPRPIDISSLLLEYQTILSETSNQKQKELLRQEMLSISSFALSGEVVERQIYIMLWEDYEDGIERDLIKRTMDMVGKFEASGIRATVMNESKIVRLCNLINNPAYANVESTSYESTIPFLIQ
ncbi:hypothetical protein CIW83_03000 [Tissierella sp. P1]|uniref:hypothetical protein n=1 Tax=Tissierella sp. P1 TaxID=1280483 RepID=UPI000BA0BA41|nr:hypothetical protein [Tissierella sp. P1]OZV13529.1 hypothetical protein CIW83_03000 [Tissierella sp. P1]